MSKARTLANLISDNAELADGQISVAEVVGAAPTANPTFTGNVSLGDNDKAIFGAGSDLQIYHDGSNSYIKEAGQGALVLQGTHMYLKSTADEYYLKNTADGSVEVYHNGSAKLATTSTGVDVTGTITSDGLTVDTNTLHVDAANNKVGIGTSLPDAKLMVSENTNDTASALFYNAAGGSGSVQGKGYIGFGIGEGWNFHGAEIGWDQEATSGYRQALTFSTRGNSDVRPTERMRIDSSGNLLVGKTSADHPTSAGVEIRPDSLRISRGSNPAAFFDRRTTDGEIARFSKNGSTVGSLSVSDGDRLNVNSGVMGFKLYDDGQAILPTNGSGTNADAQVSLGGSTVRFKDLYLSGSLYPSNGVYLGGTGSANKLDDVETGTFSPSIIAYYGNNPVISYFRQQGNYTKVGDLVHVSIMIDIQSASNLSSDLIMVGPLPFAISPGVEAEGVSNTSAWTPQRGNNISIGCHSITQSYMGFLTSNPGSGWGWEPTSIMPTGASALRLSMTYITA